MTEAWKDGFEKCCRLCAEEQDVTIMIFSQEAEAMLLQNKLNKYLLIEVEEDDRLPKNICIQCCTKLQTVCEFIDTARKAQDLLLERSLTLDDILSEQCVISSIKSEVQPAYQNSPDGDAKYTEIEVSVDPMMVLQNSEESLSPTYDDNTSMEDVTYLHGVDAENVTITLIKGDKSGKQCNSIDEDDNSETPKSFSCPTCEQSFITEFALTNHTFTHFNENYEMEKYTCSTCLKTFINKSELLTHVKLHPTSGLCQLCGRMFRSEKNYIDHMQVHLPSNKSYTCKVCGRSYNTWGSLKTHSVTHSSERPYQCQLCWKNFKRNQELRFHTNQHTGRKPYKCPFCEKCFASSGNCYSHRTRMHPGKRIEGRIRWESPNGGGEPLVPRPIAPKSSPRPTSPKSFPRPIAPKSTLTVVKGIYKYLCTTCNASFLKRDNYTYHMYQHTGEKPFHCSYCPEKFVTRRGLQLHGEREHAGSNRPLAL